MLICSELRFAAETFLNDFHPPSLPRAVWTLHINESSSPNRVFIVTPIKVKLR